MKKVIFSLIAVAALALAAFSCNNNKANEENTGSTAVEAVEASPELAPLVGKWENEEWGTYEFRADGTGLAGETNITITVDGDQMSMLPEWVENPLTFTFKVEGDKLTMRNNDNGYDVVYTRK